MMAGWLVFISFSVVFARFYKNAAAEKTVCGKQIWFMVHRLINMVAVLGLIVPAFIVIFVKVDGFTEVRTMYS